MYDSPKAAHFELVDSDGKYSKELTDKNLAARWFAARAIEKAGVDCLRRITVSKAAVILLECGVASKAIGADVWPVEHLRKKIEEVLGDDAAGWCPVCGETLGLYAGDRVVAGSRQVNYSKGPVTVITHICRGCYRATVDGEIRETERTLGPGA